MKFQSAISLPYLTLQIGKLRLGARKGLSRGERWSGRAAGCRKLTNPPPGVLLIPGGDCKASFLLKERRVCLLTSLGRPEVSGGSLHRMFMCQGRDIYFVFPNSSSSYTPLRLHLYSQASENFVSCQALATPAGRVQKFLLSRFWLHCIFPTTRSTTAQL